MKKILTVSIAAYNVENYLEECLDSFIDEETRDCCEILIVNDGSTDSTAEIAQRYVDRYPETYRLINKPNGGWGSTLNVAIQQAHGKYFKQLDGDDSFERKSMPSFLRKLREVKADMVLTNFYTFCDGTNETIGRCNYSEQNITGSIIEISALTGTWGVQMHGCTFLTELLQKSDVSLIENCFYTDVEFVIKAISCCKTAYVCDFDVYRYRLARGGQSVSLSGFAKHYKEHLCVLKSVVEFTRKASSNYRIIENRVYSLVVTEYLILLWQKPSKKIYEELKGYDRWLKANASKYYNIDMKKIKLLRATRFLAYPLIARLARRQYMESHK